MSNNLYFPTKQPWGCPTDHFCFTHLRFYSRIYSSAYAHFKKNTVNHVNCIKGIANYISFIQFFKHIFVHNEWPGTAYFLTFLITLRLILGHLDIFGTWESDFMILTKCSEGWLLENFHQIWVLAGHQYNDNDYTHLAKICMIWHSHKLRQTESHCQPGMIKVNTFGPFPLCAIVLL